MKIAVLSDIHGNYPALKSALEDCPSDIDEYIYLGDFIGLMGFPYETLELVMDTEFKSVKGNHDIAVLEHKVGHVNSKELSQFELEMNLESLTPEQIEWVTSLYPIRVVEDISAVMAHAKPYPDSASGLEVGNAGVKKRDYLSVASNFSDSYSYLFMGHTHDQAAIDCHKFGHDIVVLNPGSVGQPLGEANYAIVDTETNDFELKTVEYDKYVVTSRLKELDVPLKWW